MQLLWAVPKAVGCAVFQTQPCKIISHVINILAESLRSDDSVIREDERQIIRGIQVDHIMEPESLTLVKYVFN